jgi:hypothetical protein
MILKFFHPKLNLSLVLGIKPPALLHRLGKPSTNELQSQPQSWNHEQCFGNHSIHWLWIHMYMTHIYRWTSLGPHSRWIDKESVTWKRALICPTESASAGLGLQSCVEFLVHSKLSKSTFCSCSDPSSSLALSWAAATLQGLSWLSQKMRYSRRGSGCLGSRLFVYLSPKRSKTCCLLSCRNWWCFLALWSLM